MEQKACNCRHRNRDGNGRHDWECQSLTKADKKVQRITLEEDCDGCKDEWTKKEKSGTQSHREGCTWLAEFRKREAEAAKKPPPKKAPRPSSASDDIECNDSNWVRTETKVEIPQLLVSRWSFDSETRVLLGRLGNEVCTTEKRFILEMAEKTDIALVLEGAIPKVDDIGKEADLLCSHLSKFPHARVKFKRYDRTEDGDTGIFKYEESSSFFSMPAADFRRYLNKRWGRDTTKSFRFTSFVSGEKKQETIQNVDDVTLYMYDAELPTVARKLQNRFEESFKLIKEMYHGCRFCFTSFVS
jgi:hypothetical protein